MITRFMNAVRSFRNARLSRAQTVTMVTAFIVMLFAFPASAQTDTPTIDVDLTPLFESLNAYLPTFLGIFAVIGGISIAIALARFLINAVKSAFTGGTI